MPANFSAGFFVGSPAWHNLGKLLKNSPDNIEQGIKDAGQDWDVYSETPVLPDGTSLAGIAQCFRRSDTKAVLSVVGPRTTALQNRDAFKFFQPFLDAKEASLETAGCLDEGRRVWILAKLNRNDDEIIKGDVISKYVLLSNSHDGTLAVRLGFTPVRVVCQNTLSAAHGDKASKLIRVKHTANVKENVEAVRDTMKLADECFEATAEQYRFLARRGINQKNVKAYVKQVLGMDKPDDEMATRGKNILDKVLLNYEIERSACQEILEESKKVYEAERAAQQAVGASVLEAVLEGVETDISSANGTWWAAYNAVTRHLSHVVGRSEENRLNSLWFGPGATANKNALELAMEQASA